jgi:hypothetical protein
MQQYDGTGGLSPSPNCRRQTTPAGSAACVSYSSGIEDHAVFPLLATRMDVSKLQQDHAEMDTVIHDIEQAGLGKHYGDCPLLLL